MLGSAGNAFTSATTGPQLRVRAAWGTPSTHKVTLSTHRGYSEYSQGYSECSQGYSECSHGLSEYSQGVLIGDESAAARPSGTRQAEP
jgi:hypothetical protein